MNVEFTHLSHLLSYYHFPNRSTMVYLIYKYTYVIGGAVAIIPESIQGVDEPDV